MKFKNLFLNLKNKRGFTLFELLITTTVIAILSGTSIYVYISFQKTKLKIRIANELYDKSRLLMETLAKEIRDSYIDYEEYYNQKKSASGGACTLNCSSAVGSDCNLDPNNCSGIKYNENEEWGQIGACYGAYARIFYEGTDSKTGVCSRDIKFVGSKGSSENSEKAFDDHEQNSLYLIDLGAKIRTFFRADGNRIKKLKLICCENKELPCSGEDHDQDGICRFWKADLDFINDPDKQILNPIESSNFIDITPGDLAVTDLKFYLYPQKDPHLAFHDQSVRYHPYIKIFIKTTSLSHAEAFPDEQAPEISLSTTVSVRSYQNIKSFL